MAKLRDLVTPPKTTEDTQAAPPALETPATDTPDGPPADNHSAAIIAENERLKRRLAELEARPPLPTAFRPGIYRVSLKGCRPQAGATVEVFPRENADLAYQRSPRASYDLLSLILPGDGLANPQDRAWSTISTSRRQDLMRRSESSRPSTAS